MFKQLFSFLYPAIRERYGIGFFSFSEFSGSGCFPDTCVDQELAVRRFITVNLFRSNYSAHGYYHPVTEVRVFVAVVVTYVRLDP